MEEEALGKAGLIETLHPINPESPEPETRNPKLFFNLKS